MEELMGSVSARPIVDVIATDTVNEMPPGWRTIMDSAKLIIEVVAGLLPGRDPEPRFTKRWAITSEQWHADESDEARMLLLADRGGKADDYARTLRDPGMVNWVRTDWVWL